jgi:hypothetical protein
VIFGDAERVRELAALFEDALRRVVDREPIAVPARDRRVRFDRVVMFDRRGVGDVENAFGG